MHHHSFNYRSAFKMEVPILLMGKAGEVGRRKLAQFHVISHVLALFNHCDVIWLQQIVWWTVIQNENDFNVRSNFNCFDSRYSFLLCYLNKFCIRLGNGSHCNFCGYRCCYSNAVNLTLCAESKGL